jgi:hypothetical protein
MRAGVVRRRDAAAVFARPSRNSTPSRRRAQHSDRISPFASPYSSRVYHVVAAFSLGLECLRSLALSRSPSSASAGTHPRSSNLSLERGEFASPAAAWRFLPFSGLLPSQNARRQAEIYSHGTARKWGEEMGGCIRWILLSKTVKVSDRKKNRKRWV